MSGLDRITVVDCSAPQSGVGRYCGSLFSDRDLAARLRHVRLDRKAGAVVERFGYDQGDGRILGGASSRLPASLWNGWAGRCLAGRPRMHLTTQNLSRLAQPDSLVTVHDLFYRTLPRSGTDPWLGRWLYGGLGRAGHLVADSVATAQELDQLLGKRCPPKEVVYLFVEVPEVPHAVPEEPPYLLHVSSEEPRKNFDVALRAFALLKERPGNRDLRLIKVGRAYSAAARAEHERLAVELGVRDHLEFREGVGNLELERLYAGARALLFPSSAEGFGYPLLEALAQGCGVVAGDIPVLRELGGECVDYVPCRDAEAMADAAAVHLAGWDDARREAFRERARLFSRARFVREMNALYTKLWGAAL